MEIKIFNSLTNKVEIFKPIKKDEVSIYVCGPTVYGDPHIGNIRPPIVFDTLRRFLSYVGFKVTYVSNYTDVDDKIINRALIENKTEKEIADFYINEYKSLLRELNCLESTISPRVSEYISPIISYIDNLVKTGYAYEKDGDVFFRVSKIKDYGSLSNINLKDLEIGARIEENAKKESPLDFVLWKKTDKGINWSSPWSNGRPGWHTECCVMINSIFKPDGLIDIHGGGFDLKFPHHENEIAQSEAHNHNKIAHYFMHNGFINMGEEKMSKSLGNIILAKDIINNYGGNAVRLMIISTYYRSPVSFSEENIKTAQNEIRKIENVVKQLSLEIQMRDLDVLKGQASIPNFLDSLADDLNVSNALTSLFDLIKNINIVLRNNVDDETLLNHYVSLMTMLEILGLDISYKKLSKDDKMLYLDYTIAKKEKNYTESDRLRLELIKRNIL